jgi:hypothetical protein
VAGPLPDGQKRCSLHDITYGKLEQCSASRAERSSSVKTGSPKADTTAKRVNAATARLRELACWDACKLAMADDGNIAVKWSSESAKWARLAAELEAQITEIEHDQWLRDENMKMHGGS